MQAVLQGLPDLSFQDGVLLALAEGFEFVVRVDVGLDGEYFQRFAFFFIPVPDDDGTDHRDDQDQRIAAGGGETGLPVPAEEAAVGQGAQQAEETQVAGPDPEGSAERAGIFIPLGKGQRPGERVSEGQPGPGDLGAEIEPFPGNPGGGQEEVGNAAPEHLLAAAEEGEDDRHLQRIRQDGENAAADGGVADPEGRQGVPEDEDAVVPEPQPFHAGFRADLLHAEQGHEPEQGGPAAVRDQERNAQEDCGKPSQDRHLTFDAHDRINR